VPEELDPDAVVIRFPPTTVERIVRKAEQEFRRTGHHRLSVFADTRLPGETQLETESRLVQAAGMSGIDLKSNRNYFVGRAGDIAESFSFHKDDPSDRPEHYSVDVGTSEDLADSCDEFKDMFRGPEKVER
jgi:hypothetical protein